MKRIFQQAIRSYIRALLAGAGILPRDPSTKLKAAQLQHQLDFAAMAGVVPKVKSELNPEDESDRRASARPRSVGSTRRSPVQRTSSNQRKSMSRVSSDRSLAFNANNVVPFYLRCPAVLRKWLNGCRNSVECRCIKKMPTITDFEFDTFLSARVVSTPQVLVVVIVSSQKPTLSANLEEITHNMYRAEQQGRRSPCIQCTHDLHRFVKYDLHGPLMEDPPLLVEKNCAYPGIVLMYRGGKLLFGGSVFNGYGCSKKDLMLQVNRAHSDYKMGHFLPDNYKFSPCSQQGPLSDIKTPRQKSVKCHKELERQDPQKKQKGPDPESCVWSNSLTILMNSLPERECPVSTTSGKSSSVKSSQSSQTPQN